MDGAAVDRSLLLEMTSFMAFRGPDAQEVWAEGRAGLGHTLLRTTVESVREHQPSSLDGQVWITADARIDGQAELKRELSALGRTNLAAALDHELILHAYHAWGESCVEHLIGDFAFAIWDEPRQKLFCARDHFGVKPFFYAQLGQSIVFSNTLNCVRQHPEIPDELDDLAIADFLLFGANKDPATTSFAHIKRLRAGHALSFTQQGLKVRRYWQFPTDRPVEYRKGGDYTKRFMELLEQAVNDRLRGDHIGIEMSGGLDSTSVAAVAKSLLVRRGTPFKMHIQTIVYDRLFHDDERKFASMAAEVLAIPADIIAADDYQLFENADEPKMWTPEPDPDPVLIRSVDTYQRAARAGRVMLTGWEGDGFLNESPKPYFRQLLANGRVGRFLFEAIGYAITQRKFVPSGKWQWLTGRTTIPQSPGPAYPDWIDPDLERRFDLKARWNRYQQPYSSRGLVSANAARTAEALTEASPFFDYFDPGRTGCAVEYRHPLLDLRLLDYCLSLPPHPWRIHKHVLREAMRGKLPEKVRIRPKTGLAGYPYLELLSQPDARWLDDFVANDGLNRYVKTAGMPRPSTLRDPEAAWIGLRPLCLNIWLGNRRPKITINSELSHDT